MNTTFIDKLCLRRLCLPANTDVDRLRSGLIKSNMCECGNSHHIACAVEGKGSCLKCTKLWDEHV